jgi:monothiol glutaredoxin
VAISGKYYSGAVKINKEVAMQNLKIKDRIEADLKNNRIMLYMKGDRQQPMCGFSAQVVQILDSYGVAYHTENVLADWDLREGIKEFASWPTIPQLYVDGQFIGGCDIIATLHRKGELRDVLTVK